MSAKRARVTYDALTGRQFYWNGTCRVRTRDGHTWVVPQLMTPKRAEYLHPNRVPPELLAELNPNPPEEN